MKRLFDERQELESLRAKRITLCVLFWITALSLVIKTYILELPLGYWVTECLIIFVSAALEVKLEAGKGMFDPYFRPTGKNCLLLALAGAVPLAVIKGIVTWYRYPNAREDLGAVIMGTAIFFLFLCALIYAVLMANAIYAKHMQKKLEQDLEMEDEDDG